MPFNLTLEDIRVPKYCPLLGTLLEFGGAPATSPSIDRLDPAKGYTKDNIWVISRRANAIKNDATPEELHRLTHNLVKKLLD